MRETNRFIVETTFHVRYAETDKMGVVHHSAYLVWFEEGRSEFARAQGRSYAQIEAAGYTLAAGELHATYKQAARYDQLITVRTWIEQRRSRTVTFGCEVVDAASARPLFEATLTLICVNSKGLASRIPRDWHDWLRL